jgi:hypothetical protein
VQEKLTLGGDGGGVFDLDSHRTVTLTVTRVTTAGPPAAEVALLTGSGSIDPVHPLLESGALGKIESFDFREGAVFNWPATTNSFWRRETAGGGVLADQGAHVLDLLLWWLGDFTSLTYVDDSQGGVEADCRLELSMKSGARESTASA